MRELAVQSWLVWRREGMIALCGRALAYMCPRLSAQVLATRLKRLSGNASLDELLEFARTQCGGLIRPGQICTEFRGLVETVFDGPKPACIMEIGTHRGGTLFVFARSAAPQACLISVDLPGGEFGGGYPDWKTSLYRKFALPQQELHLVRADSHAVTTVEQVRQILQGRRLDFLFIDGDHTYEGVKRDFELYSPLVRPGGLIAFHDIAEHPPESDCHVHRFWREISADYVCQEFLTSPTQGWAGIGLLRFPADDETSSITMEK
jgi:predicted O-methyltransferase YrrM